MPSAVTPGHPDQLAKQRPMPPQVQQKLRVPLHAQQEPAAAFHGLYDAVEVPCGNLEVRAERIDALVVQTVDAGPTATEDGRKARARRHQQGLQR